MQKRRVADSFLVYLKERNLSEWPSTYLVLCEAGEEMGEQVYNLWKAYELLRMMGRIELNSPNGKKGVRVVDFTPLSHPIPEDVRVCSEENCPILQRIPVIFKEAGR